LIANVDSFEVQNIERDLEDLHTRVYQEFKNIYPDDKSVEG
jgi:hypothetical protein